ncbi:hypothetical protein SAMN02910291_02972 [Desulfovibrio desulfuricans]|uniref:Uncharacterized protein n=1 Tax=Desulfovibrio desulfuricans TaxID=876 RepID=A0AA94L3N9_DESDE|nr:hypothetical protein SAMN02910291_02972 [Desulfovibrio desulfuricans]SPD36558.1 Hypothetical protein DSVG11_2519 [Desulfovibrio sp. G11]
MNLKPRELIFFNHAFLDGIHKGHIHVSAAGRRALIDCCKNDPLLFETFVRRSAVAERLKVFIECCSLIAGASRVAHYLQIGKMIGGTFNPNHILSVCHDAGQGFSHIFDFKRANSPRIGRHAKDFFYIFSFELPRFKTRRHQLGKDCAISPCGRSGALDTQQRLLHGFKIQPRSKKCPSRCPRAFQSAAAILNGRGIKLPQFLDVNFRYVRVIKILAFTADRRVNRLFCSIPTRSKARASFPDAVHAPAKALHMADSVTGGLPYAAQGAA